MEMNFLLVHTFDYFYKSEYSCVLNLNSRSSSNPHPFSSRELHRKSEVCLGSKYLNRTPYTQPIILAVVQVNQCHTRGLCKRRALDFVLKKPALYIHSEACWPGSSLF